MKKILTTILLSATVLCGMAQKIRFSKFEHQATSAEARTEARMDRITKENCALLHVYATDIAAYDFEGKIEGLPILKKGEAILYLRPGSISLTAKHPKYGKATIEFDDAMRSENVYSINIDVFNNKTRTIVMPTVGIGKTLNYGLMVGLVKKYGGYIKAKYNFKNIDSDLECNKMGYTLTGDQIWFNDKEEESSRLSVTAGALYRIKEPLFLYGGLGFGNYTYAWQTTDDRWVKNTDVSCEGVQAEVGVIGHYRNVAVGIGIETCQFKYWEMNLGVGIIF